MTSKQPTPPNPDFPTPQPQDLQSEEERAAVHRRLEERQGGETDTVTDPAERVDTPSPNDADVFQDMDRLSNRHLPSIDSPPG